MAHSQFKLNGLTCEACVKLVTKRLGRIADIQKILIDLTGTLSIDSARDVSKAEIEAALAGTPYIVA